MRRDRDARLLTRSAYQAIGGVAGALATYADEVFASLGKKEQGIARDVFARLVAAAFSMRRKTLRNSLRGLIDTGQFAAAGIEADRRPETLAPAEFARLAAL